MAWWWSGFALFIILFLIVDLRFKHYLGREQTPRVAVIWSLFWVLVACVFTCMLGFWYPQSKDTLRKPALEFFTGYLVEKSLSLDNLFVIASIFTSLQIAPVGQERALSWGIIGAIIMRFAMILLGTALFAYFHWMPLLFGGILLYTAFRMGWKSVRQHFYGHVTSTEEPISLGVLQRWIPLTHQSNQSNHNQFFVIENGARKATTLFLALIQVEFCDLLFAIDSIPAIFAITRDPFIVMSSNVFAIFGLRALYLLLSHALPYLRFLHLTLSVLLGFVGIKMLLSLVYPIPLLLAFAIMAGILTIGILASLYLPKNDI